MAFVAVPFFFSLASIHGGCQMSNLKILMGHVKPIEFYSKHVIVLCLIIQCRQNRMDAKQVLLLSMREIGGVS